MEFYLFLVGTWECESMREEKESKIQIVRELFCSDVRLDKKKCGFEKKGLKNERRTREMEEEEVRDHRREHGENGNDSRHLKGQREREQPPTNF